jgi:dTMP kinase
MKGVFVSFEGAEGSGKSTQIRWLGDVLGLAGREVILTREPGGTDAGEVIRNLLQHDAAGEKLCPEAETLLFCASRAQLVQEVIAPALARGAIVLCDRFADSTTAYQGYGRGLDPDQLIQIHDFTLGCYWPDITILLDLPVDVGMRRIRKRAKEETVALDRMEREQMAFHERVLHGFHLLAKQHPERFCVVDAAASIEDVRMRIVHALSSVLPELEGLHDG